MISFFCRSSRSPPSSRSRSARWGLRSSALFLDAHDFRLRRWMYVAAMFNGMPFVVERRAMSPLRLVQPLTPVKNFPAQPRAFCWFYWVAHRLPHWLHVKSIYSRFWPFKGNIYSYCCALGSAGTGRRAAFWGVTLIASRGGRGMSTKITLTPTCAASFGSTGGKAFCNSNAMRVP